MSDQEKAQVERVRTPRTFPYVQELKKPIDAGGRTITRLEWSEFRLEHLKGVAIAGGGEMSVDAVVQIAARATGEAAAFIGKLGASDSRELMEVAGDFFGEFAS